MPPPSLENFRESDPDPGSPPRSHQLNETGCAKNLPGSCRRAAARPSISAFGRIFFAASATGVPFSVTSARPNRMAPRMTRLLPPMALQYFIVLILVRMRERAVLVRPRLRHDVVRLRGILLHRVPVRVVLVAIIEPQRMPVLVGDPAGAGGVIGGRGSLVARTIAPQRLVHAIGAAVDDDRVAARRGRAGCVDLGVDLGDHLVLLAVPHGVAAPGLFDLLFGRLGVLRRRTGAAELHAGLDVDGLALVVDGDARAAAVGRLFVRERAGVDRRFVIGVLGWIGGFATWHGRRAL